MSLIIRILNSLKTTGKNTCFYFLSSEIRGINPLKLRYLIRGTRIRWYFSYQFVISQYGRGFVRFCQMYFIKLRIFVEKIRSEKIITAKNNIF